MPNCVLYKDKVSAERNTIPVISNRYNIFTGRCAPYSSTINFIAGAVGSSDIKLRIQGEA